MWKLSLRTPDPFTRLETGSVQVQTFVTDPFRASPQRRISACCPFEAQREVSQTNSKGPGERLRVSLGEGSLPTQIPVLQGPPSSCEVLGMSGMGCHKLCFLSTPERLDPSAQEQWETLRGGGIQRPYGRILLCCDNLGLCPLWSGATSTLLSVVGQPSHVFRAYM